MITNFQIFESMNISVGDEVVALSNRYAEKGYWVKSGRRYEVLKVDNRSGKIRVRDIERNIYFFPYFNMRDFVTIEEWEAKRYNI